MSTNCSTVQNPEHQQRPQRTSHNMGKLKTLGFWVLWFSEHQERPHSPRVGKSCMVLCRVLEWRCDNAGKFEMTMGTPQKIVYTYTVEWTYSELRWVSRLETPKLSLNRNPHWRKAPKLWAANATWIFVVLATIVSVVASLPPKSKYSRSSQPCLKDSVDCLGSAHSTVHM
eukprot:4188955-Amphidinium_carterae.1